MEFMTQNYALIIWIVAAIIFFIVEAMTAGLVSLWFVAGAVGAIIVTLLGGGLVLQFIVFLVISIACIFALKPLSQKFIGKGNTKDMYGDTKLDQGPIGKKAKVVEEVNNDNSTGAVFLEGKTWTARADESCEDEIMPVDSFVEITNVSGVKLLVKKFNKGEE